MQDLRPDKAALAVQAVCRMYAADYACLGYALPNVCQGQGWGSTLELSTPKPRATNGKITAEPQWCQGVVFVNAHKSGHLLALALLNILCLVGPDVKSESVINSLKNGEYWQNRADYPKNKPIGTRGIKAPKGSSGEILEEDDVLLPLGAPGRPDRMVLFIRDPLEIIVSGYQYHLVSSEKWLQTSRYQAKLLSLGEEAGLAEEFFRVTVPGINASEATAWANEASWVADASNQTGFSILGSLCRLYTKSKHRPRVFVNRMENSVDDFDAAISRLIDWLGLGHSIGHYDLEAVRLHDPHHHSNVSGSAASVAPEHFSRLEDKGRLRSLLMAAHERRRVVHMYQACLGYKLWEG